MKLTSAINLAVFNVVGLILAVLIAGDQAYRLSYWRSMGFTPHTDYYPFFLITTATKGTTYIPGLLTIDWLQVLVVILAVVDSLMLIGYVRRRGLSERLAGLPKDK
jgi:hypothetical protein